ncbi:GFA family protein [Paeniroseomonas aquatica]|uniref:GFA family protein n=1 Tax=Paeniroseomonas aquatica TaxID=373043 RepID=A0ABT8AGD7_9PROT|nr:GFA family protein [Paeniroseomonas aquatica]MDN3568758.1 GFA family protein [Paeniroseomonas aquatica]
MKLPLIGGCVCGAVRYEVTHKPTRVYACHCTDCQRVTTSAFSIGVSVPGEAFRVTGKELQPVPGGITEGGRAKTRWVCPDCGIWICGGVKVGTEPPDYTRHVRGGTLDDTSWLRPTLHFFARSKQPWVILPEDATVYEAAPPRA